MLKLRSILLDTRLYIANYLVAFVPAHWFRLAYYRGVMRFKIGVGSSIHMGAKLSTIGRFVMGDHSVINADCRVDSRGGLHIGSSVSISSGVAVVTASHDVRDAQFAGSLGGVEIRDYVFIGTRAMILPGVTVGEGAVVAAGAVVVRDVEPYAIVAGVPARTVGSRPTELNYIIDYRRLFH